MKNKFRFGSWASYPNFWGFGCGYETHTQNPNPDFLGVNVW